MSLVVQKTPETPIDKGFLLRRQIWDSSRDRTKAMVLRRYFDRLGRLS
jgi:hypothetical protein